MTAFPSRAAVVALSLIAGPAAAEGPSLGAIGCPAEAVTIAVLGDSLADGLWGSFFRAFAACPTVDVLRLTTVSDGLAKSDASDWLGRLGPEGQGADLIVVQMGANDITNIREGTTRAVFGSPEWEAAYGARAAELAEGLVAVTPDVVWMGLPIVGQERFEESYRAITAIQAAAAEAAGVAFVDTHEPTSFGLGEFVMSAEIDGTLRQIRNTDQVHFTEVGYDMVAGLIRGDVEQLFRKAGSAAAIDALVLQ
ncbi:DUF459 domain-containing protein [Wenxinia marina]|uniref:Uncharacterized protein n=1 Tax=Wenxinia marina DSM 24838 TaxID=1123501 RepID=A0A0D0QD98_9RHOB|nr:GDSL-type esterase/lipase family protein [Wenxinia marina]KIQ68978.1 hypothetical protein Wenmar_02711 [Wenxinia marina DSM 24838]GGL63622.1 hypothetical protein GCM10011392_17940 [Wenxinia marina]